jgi:Tol biopolymer transport system component
MRLDRLDKAALAFVAALLALIALVLLRGDQVGVQIARTAPAANAAGVATRAQISFSFTEPMEASTMEGRVRVTPPLSGTLRWNGSTAFFVPRSALQPDTTYTITVLAGGRSTRGRDLLRDVSWSFRTGHPRLAYLSPATGVGDLYITEMSGDTPQRITSEPYGVFDFAVSPDGLHIAYSATRDDSGARDLWLINPDGSGRERLVACDQQVCQTPSWSADSTRIAFERRNLVKGTVGVTPGPSRIWLYDLPSKAQAPLVSDSQQLGTLPRWAPTGDRLAYYDPLASAIIVLDVVTGERVQLASVLGDSGTWSPDASQLIYPELEAVDLGGSFSQLLRADLMTNIITPVSPLSTSNDTTAVWSPVGDLIAFTRQRTGARAATGGFTPFGPQLWVSTPTGEDMRPLTQEPEFSHGGPAWSPDGEWIAVVRNNLQQPNPKPEVWLVRRDGGEKHPLAQNATLPAWLP